jgi:hypothetical protein
MAAIFDPVKTACRTRAAGQIQLTQDAGSGSANLYILEGDGWSGTPGRCMRSWLAWLVNAGHARPSLAAPLAIRSRVATAIRANQAGGSCECCTISGDLLGCWKARTGQDGPACFFHPNPLVCDSYWL